MRFMAVGEFVANTARARRRLDAERAIVLTFRGKPFALVTPVEADTAEEHVVAVRQARAVLAIDRMQKSARRAGLDKMTMDEIDALITISRKGN